MSRTTEGVTSRRAVGLGLVAVLVALAAVESASPIARDDFGFLMWGLQSRADAWAWLAGPAWSAYHRPLNALVWWLSAREGVDGAVVRWVQAALWVGTGALVVGAGWRERRVAITAALLLLTNQVFVDLLRWRSWLTTTGSLFFLAAGLLVLQARRPPWMVALAGVLALGFKEMSPLAIAVACVLTPGYRLVGAGLAALVALASAGAAGKLDMGHVIENAGWHLGTLALFASAVPLILALKLPRAPVWALLASASLVMAPAPVAAVAFLGACGFALAATPALGAACAVALLLPLLGEVHARQYLLEGWVVVLLSLAGPAPLRRLLPAWAAALLIAVPSWLDFERDRRSERAVFEEQQAFLTSFHPAPARLLYHPDPAWSWDLDALVWVEGGAELAGQPPAGTEPVQVGPRSGVWADVQTAPPQGAGTM